MQINGYKSEVIAKHAKTTIVMAQNQEFDLDRKWSRALTENIEVPPLDYENWLRESLKPNWVSHSLMWISRLYSGNFGIFDHTQSIINLGVSVYRA